MRKRIALISEHASPLAIQGGTDSGGQNVYVAQIAHHLPAFGYEVDIFTRRDRKTLPPILEWRPGVRIIHVPAGPALTISKEDLLPHMEEFTQFMIQFCQNEKPTYDLIHANFWMSGLVAAELKQRLQIPFVITFHALGRVRRLHQKEADQFPDLRFTIEDRLVTEADSIIAECPQDREDLLNLYTADPQRIVIIPCGFDPTEFWPLDHNYARAQIGLLTSERIILQLGRIVPRKGLETVLQGLAHLKESSAATPRLLIVGGESHTPDPALTPEIGRLQKLSQELGISSQVTFIGRRRRSLLRYYYNAADLFVTLPWYEPFGITPLEAMACARPVIGSRVGGIQFTVVDGKTGYLIPPLDAPALAERLHALLQAPQELTVLGQQGYQHVHQHFTWQHITQTLVQLYKKIQGNQNSIHPSFYPLSPWRRSQSARLFYDGCSSSSGSWFPRPLTFFKP